MIKSFYAIKLKQFQQRRWYNNSNTANSTLVRNRAKLFNNQKIVGECE